MAAVASSPSREDVTAAAAAAASDDALATTMETTTTTTTGKRPRRRGTLRTLWTTSGSLRRFFYALGGRTDLAALKSESVPMNVKSSTPEEPNTVEAATTVEGNGAIVNVVARPPPAHASRHGSTGNADREHGHGHGHAHGHGKTSSVRRTLWLAFSSLGIIYGDIGTSPLYVMSAIFENKPPAQEDVIGALSLIIWSITLVVLIKYVGFMLLADDNGEGGAFAMCSILSRGLRRRMLEKNGGGLDGDDPEASDFKDTKFERWNSVIYAIALISAAAAFGDGVLTPAISVLSAVEGLAVPTPELAVAVIPITMGILLGLFLIQRFGTRRVSQISAPAITLWLLSLFGIGIYNLTFAPVVLRALSPSYAFDFFIRNGRAGWIQLGAVVLCITGVEALYADLGHFSRASIRLSCAAVTYPCVVLAYMGQAAKLYVDPNLITNAFYQTLPTVTYYPMLALATLATVIASQAMISASFSIIHQAVRLQCFPRVTVIHTDEHSEGQVYVPVMNYFLMVACLLVVLAFRTSSALATAYGVAVCFNMLIDSATFSTAIFLHFRKPWPLSVAFFLFFGMIDATFLSANLNKFLSGGWFPIALAVLLSITMFVWRWGRLRVMAKLRALSVAYGGNLSHELRILATTAAIAEGNWWERGLKSRASPTDKPVAGGDSAGDASTTALTLRANNYASLEDDNMAPQPDSSAAAVAAAGGTIAYATAAYDARPQMPGVYFFYTSISDAVPAAFVHMVRLLPIRPEHLVFVTVEVVNVPRVENYLKFGPVPGVPGVYRAVVIIGYMEFPPTAAQLAPRLLRALLATNKPPVPPAAALAAAAAASSTSGAGAAGPDFGEPAATTPGDADDDAPSETGAGVDEAAAGVDEVAATPDGAARSDAPREASEWSDADLLSQYQPVFLLGRDRVISKYGAGRIHRMLVELFSWEMKLSRTILATMQIPPSRILEVGFLVEI